MKKRKYTTEIAFRLTDAQKAAIMRLADTEELGIGEAARMLLDAGMRAKGIA